MDRNHNRPGREKPFGFVKTTLLGALLVVVPVAIVGFALWQVVAITRALFLPVFDNLPIGDTTLRLLIIIAAVLVLILACYFTGLLVRTRWGRRLRGWFERTFLERIPGYKMVRSLAHQYLGHEVERKFQPVIVDVHGTGAKMVGLEIEELPDGTVAVFFPLCPRGHPRAGADRARGARQRRVGLAACDPRDADDVRRRRVAPDRLRADTVSVSRTEPQLRPTHVADRNCQSGGGAVGSG